MSTPNNEAPPSEAGMAADIRTQVEAAIAFADLPAAFTCGQARELKGKILGIIDRAFDAERRTHEQEVKSFKDCAESLATSLNEITDEKVTLAAQLTTSTDQYRQAERERDDAKSLFERHTKAVGEFMNELYALAIDPLEDGKMEVSEMKSRLLKAAKYDRTLCESVAELERERDGLRADGVIACRLLVHCFRRLGDDIDRMSLNESASNGTQSLSREIAAFLDAARTPTQPEDGK